MFLVRLAALGDPGVGRAIIGGAIARLTDDRPALSAVIGHLTITPTE
jgi:hypothetical protein